MSKTAKWAIGIGALFVIGVLAQSGGGSTSAPSRDTTTASVTQQAERAPSSGPATILDSAIVWTTRESMDRGLQVIQSGAHRANPDLLVPLVACLVTPGTPISVIGMATFRREIAVDAGSEKGCTGWIAAERAGRRR